MSLSSCAPCASLRDSPPTLRLGSLRRSSQCIIRRTSSSRSLPHAAPPTEPPERARADRARAPEAVVRRPNCAQREVPPSAGRIKRGGGV